MRHLVSTPVLASGTGLVAIITSMVSLGPLATDMYLPALPALTDELDSSVREVQLTLSVFLVGFALAQLIYGPMADRFGRKPVMLAGLSLFVLATLGCATSDTIAELISWRLAQALGGAAGPVLGRTMVRDLYGPQDAARVLSYVGAAMGLAPAIGPVIGGYLIVEFGWPSTFYLLALYGLLVIGLLQFKVGETLAKEHRQPFRLRPMLANFSRLVSNRVFVGYSLALSGAYAALFAFISGSSFVVVDYFQVAPEHFGYFFTAIVIGYVCGTFSVGRLGYRFSGHQLLTAGTLLAVVSAIVLVAIVVVGRYNLYGVIAAISFASLTVGMVMPQAMAGGLAPFAHMAGTAASLMGFMQMGIAAMAGIAVGYFHDGTPAPTLLVTASMALATAISYRVLVGNNPTI